jgi:heme exporter protein CcmD
MDWSADHVGFVFAAYAIVGLVLMGLLLNTVLKARRLKRVLKDLKLSEPGQSESAP